MRFTMIPVEDRNKWHCYYCGETRSVKYIFHSNGTALPVCNRCAAMIGMGKDDKDEPEDYHSEEEFQ